MDLRRVLAIVGAACEASGARWAVIGGVAMSACGHARPTYDLDVASEDKCREGILRVTKNDGFRVLSDAPAFSNLLHPDRDLGRLDFLWLDEETFEEVFTKVRVDSVVEGVRISVAASLPWGAYFDFLKQHSPTKEQLEALPLSPDVPPFRLD